MATLRKRHLKNGTFVWMIDFHYKGKRSRISTGTSNRKIAEKALDKIKGDIVSEKFNIPENNKTKIGLQDFIKIYLEYSKNFKSANTFVIEKNALRQFYDFIGEVSLSNIKLKDGENFILYLLDINSKTSINIKTRVIKTSLSKAVKLGFLKENPFLELKPLPIDKSTFPQYLNNQQIKKLLEVIKDERYKSLVLFYLNTGCRRNEALNLKWKDVDLKNRKVYFHITKSRESRIVPINKSLYAVLKLMHDKNAEDNKKVFDYKPDWITHRIKDYFKKIGYESTKSVHALRHTFASHLVMSGVDLYTVQKLLGHSDISITQIYSHLAPDYLANSVEKLDY